MADKKPIVVMKDITIEFPGVKALDGVSLRLFPGEIHALMGENGAGKSTMIKALTGVYEINGGSIEVNGRPVTFHGTADAEKAGIGTVYQEINLCTNLTIGENVMLGHEIRNKIGGIDWKKTNAASLTYLRQIGMGDIDPKTELSTLSIARQQMVAIARSLVINAKVLILDEPTSSLDEDEVQQLFTIMRTLRDRGVAILFVSHFIEQVYEVSDRMTILRNGRLIKECMVKDTPSDKLIEMMIGKSADSLASIDEKKSYFRPQPGAKPILSVRGIARRGNITPTDLDLYSGEITGFAGLLGSGRTELARLLFGADKPEQGSYTLDGQKVAINDPYQALKKSVAYSTENRRDEGIIGDLTVRQNILIALQAVRGMMHPIPKKEGDEIVARYMKSLNVHPNNPDMLIKNLSGGNQQKVLLARWLAAQPKVLILDEPTRGIDIGAKAEIQEAVMQLAHQGIAVIFISSEMTEVVRISDKIEVLKDQHKIKELENDGSITQDNIVDIIAHTKIEGSVNDRKEA